jgi:hypothetical protein
MGETSGVASESDDGGDLISGEEALYFPLFSRAIWVYKMNIRMDWKNGVKWVKNVQLRRLSKHLTEPKPAQSSMDREIWPIKLDKILGIGSMMYQEAIPKKETSNSFYIER